MNRQNKKTFLILYILLSIFFISVLLVFNIINYEIEKNNISKNLDYLQANNELENISFLDSDIYTVVLENNEISKIYTHGHEDAKFNVEKISRDILKKNNLNKKVIGNLYFKKYSYNFRYKHSIIIINNKDVNKRLTKTLLFSLLVLLVVEVLLYYILKKIVKLLVRPVKDISREKSLLVDASHELKGPLDIIINSSNELIKDNKNKKQVNTIQFEVERMNRLLNKFLELAKLDNNHSKNSLKIENLSSILENCCMNLEKMAFEKQIEISQNIDSDVTLKCYREEIDKLFTIIVDNAIKHCPKKSTIKVELLKPKSDIIIRVTNPGSPIKPGDEDKIFETFYRSNEEGNRSNNRYGLKLAVAKNIVTKHNGIINAYSRDGLTTFKIVFKK